MKLIHTLKTLKTNEKFYNLIWCTTLSCLYAKESGFNIKLYTDSIAYKYLKHLPYDDIEVSLDDLPVIKSIYANSKYYALKKEPLDSIHIDCDVFLKSKFLYNEINNLNSFDVIVQNLEIRNKIIFNDQPHTKYGGGWDFANLCKQYFKPIWLKDKCDTMVNCGIIGFNNQTLKDTFIKSYEEGINIINNLDKFNNNIITDLVIEQQNLYDLCVYNNYNIKYLLNANTIQEDAIVKGYQHLIGDSKNKYITKIKQLVYKKDYKLYNKLNKLIKL